MKSRPIIITQSVLAGMDVIALSSALGDLVPLKVAIAFVLVTKAVQVGVAFYVQSITMPFEDAAAYVNDEGQVVAGPAAGVTNGKTVDVVKTEPPSSEGEFVEPN